MAEFVPSASRNLRSLWRAVLIQAARDLGGVGAMSAGARRAGGRSLQQSQTASWIGTRDFRLVCEMAEIDADCAAYDLANLASAPSDQHQRLREILVFAKQSEAPRA